MSVYDSQGSVGQRSRLLGGSVVRASDFRPSDHGFDSRSGRNQGRSTQPSIPPGSVNRVLAFTGRVRLCRVASNIL